MMTKITLLAVIAAATFAADQPELPTGTTLMVPPTVADELIAKGAATLAGEDVALSDLEALAPVASKDPGKTPPSPSKGKAVRVRVLASGAHGKANDVVELPADVAKQLEADGQVDSNKAAVAYAMTLEQNQR